MTVLGVRGRVLPSGELRTVFFDNDRITFDPVPHVELLHDGGWILPGLVDVHTHPGADKPGDSLNETLLRENLAAQAGNGVTLVRTPGIAGGVVPTWVHDDATLPRVIESGHWLAPPDGFFPGWAREAPAAALADAAMEEATHTGQWCKLIVDWSKGTGEAMTYEPTIAPDVVADIVAAVHAVGGRIAVHTQHPDGAEAAVLAGADSLEHGMLLPERCLTRMAEQGTALVPTMIAFEALDEIRALDAPTNFLKYLIRGYERHPAIVRAAHEAGVVLLAGTDSHLHHGLIAQEAALIARTGVTTATAVGAASWTARGFLGLPLLDEGAPADMVIYATDPREDVGVLRDPERIVLKGRVRA